MKYIFFDIGSVVLYKDSSAYNKDRSPNWLNALNNKDEAIALFMKEKVKSSPGKNIQRICNALSKISGCKRHEIINLWKNWYARYYKWTPGMKGFIETLGEEHYTGVCSNVGWISQEVRTEMNVYNVFNGDIFLSYEINLSKPDLRIFSYILKKTGADPKDVIFIDNKEENVIAARKVGISTIHFKSMSQLKTDLGRIITE